MISQSNRKTLLFPEQTDIICNEHTPHYVHKVNIYSTCDILTITSMPGALKWNIFNTFISL